MPDYEAKIEVTLRFSAPSDANAKSTALSAKSAIREAFSDRIEVVKDLSTRQLQAYDAPRLISDGLRDNFGV